MRVFPIFIILFFLSNINFASYYKLKIIPEKKEVYLGEKFKIFIEISSDENIKNLKIVYPKELKYLEPSKPILLKKKSHKVVYYFYLQFFKTGNIKIPSIKVIINGYEFFSNNLEIKVKSNLKPNTTFKDIKPPETVEFYLTKKEKILIISFLILLILILITLNKIRKKSKILTDKTVDSTIYKLPYEEALENLSICENLIKQEKIKEFYFHLSYTLRKYIDRKLKLNTLEMTTPELEKFSKINKDIMNILKKCDYVKFTGNIPKLEEVENDFKNVKKIIEQMEYYK